jgi:hypothetical protein
MKKIVVRLFDSLPAVRQGRRIFVFAFQLISPKKKELHRAALFCNIVVSLKIEM